MRARRRDHITAIPANIESDAEPTGRVSDLTAGMLEVVVLATAAGFAAGRLGQFAELALELVQGLGALVTVDVEDQEPGVAAGTDSDAGIRPALPPLADPRRVRSGVFQAVRRPRRLVAPHSEHAPAAPGVTERGLDRVVPAR